MDQELLTRLAAKYIWWKPPQEAIKTPSRVIAQVMELGDYADVLSLLASAGAETLRRVICQAEPGIFRAKSWTYWHYRLGLAAYGQVPALPQRRVA